MDTTTEAKTMTATPSFNAWLCMQQHRRDVVGELARHARADREWPRTSAYYRIMRHLVETRKPGLVLGLALAWQEYIDTDTHKETT
jgi:hypothetical protein